ncbi:MAG: RNA polymerase sigma-54 factor [Spirochaetales bacterium]|nr:RNA polymerase sigma-54 factor [Spirochaetales bacterium]
MKKIKLNQKINPTQKSFLSPKSRLFVKFINLNLSEINEMVEKELTENPCIEEEVNENSVELENFDNLPPIRQHEIGANEFNENIVEDKSANLVDYLLMQLNLLDTNEDDQKSFYAIIRLLDDDGLLKYKNDEIADIIKEQAGVEINNIEIEELILKAQRVFDPPGIFTRSVKESLILQLELSNNENLPIYSKIINNHLENLANKKFDVIANDMHVKTDLIQNCLDVVSELEPRPARSFIKINNQEFDSEPEAYIYQIDNKLVVQINKNFKNIRISPYYQSMMVQVNKIDSEVIDYVKSKIDDGKTLMKTILERNAIYSKVLKIIVDIQHDYIIKGDRFLKPLTLSDVASIVGSHESTISRITSNKFVSTPRGLINLRSFFSNKIDSQDDASAVAVKDMIDELVRIEDKKNPSSDEELKKILEKKGISISRRTIAKYRNILKIPSSFKRRNK